MHPLLETIRPALPPNEWAALTAWLTTFYPFQLEWLLEPARFALYLKSRQIGASHTTGAWSVLHGAFLGETTTIISVGVLSAVSGCLSKSDSIDVTPFWTSPRARYS